MKRFLILKKDGEHFIYLFEQGQQQQLIEQLKHDHADLDFRYDSALLSTEGKRGRDGRRLSSGDPAIKSSAALNEKTLAELTIQCLRSRTP